MSSIPAGVILIHVGTHASIPAGWTRETSLDSKFTKGWGAENPNTTGGTTTHTHTSDSHSHTLNAHTHTYTTSSVDWDFNGGSTGNDGQDNFNGSHYHTGTSGAASGGTISGTLTYAASSNNPPFRKVIFVKASAGTQLSDDICALWGGWNSVATVPNNWTEVTEVRGRYLQGAGTGANADLTTDNGSTTNSHGITHSHTSATHTHVAANSSGPSSINRKSSSGGQNYTSAGHVHSISLNAGTQNTNQNADTLTPSETVEPAYKKLTLIKKGASAMKEKGIIGMWLGGITAAALPGGWVLCDGNNGTLDMRDKHLKIGTSTSELGTTGGSNTHTHAAQSHSHTSNGGHTHSGSGGNHPGGNFANGSGQNCFTSGSNSHTITSDSTTSSYAAANTTANSSSNEPEYRTVAYIQFQKNIAGGGLLLFNMLT